jgi:hypothetical protein
MAGFAFDPVTAGISGAASLGQLLIGENSLFSGKKRRATRELEKNFQAGQSAGINKGYYDVLSAQKSKVNEGISGASLGLARMEQGRAQAAQLGALGGRRSALAGLPGLGINSSDFALRLAASNEMAQRQNQQQAEQTQLQVAGLEDMNAQRKRDEAASYYQNQRQESDASISSALQGLGGAIGAGVQSGQFNKMLDSGAFKGMNMYGATGNMVFGSKDSFLKSLMKQGANTFVQSGANALGQNLASSFVPQKFNTNRLSGNYGNFAPGLGTSRSVLPKYYGG